jgi:hypothetical protein
MQFFEYLASHRYKSLSKFSHPSGECLGLKDAHGKDYHSVIPLDKRLIAAKWLTNAGDTQLLSRLRCLQSMIFQAAKFDGYWVESSDLSSRWSNGRLEITARKLSEGALIFEEDNLTECLPTQLKADCQLGHCCIANVNTLGVDPTLAMSTTNAHATFSDSRKYGIAVAFFKNDAGYGLPKYVNSVRVIIRPS